jgi:hypothetical protein
MLFVKFLSLVEIEMDFRFLNNGETGAFDAGKDFVFFSGVGIWLDKCQCTLNGGLSWFRGNL